MMAQNAGYMVSEPGVDQASDTFVPVAIRP